MLPITKTIPKEMLPVWEKPVIQYIVEDLSQSWIKDILMITSQQKKALEDYFDKNYELEDSLKKKGKEDLLALVTFPKSLANYAFVKQTQQLGTAHAISQVAPRINDDFFIVIFWDAIYPPTMISSLLQTFEKTKKPVVCVHEVAWEEVHNYGVVKIEWEIIKEIVEKPKREDAPSNLVCNGVYLLPKEIFDYIKKTPLDEKRGEYLLPDTLNLLMKERDVAYVKVEPFRDIWDMKMLMKANAKMYTDGKLF